MGFVKKNINLEEYLNSINIEWQMLTDTEYKRVLKELNGFIDSSSYSLFSGGEAYSKLMNQLPLNGYIFSAPKHKYFSVYENGDENHTFGYLVENVEHLDREAINCIECVVANEELSFACVFNHEWQAHCPEQYFEKAHNQSLNQTGVVAVCFLQRHHAAGQLNRYTL